MLPNLMLCEFCRLISLPKPCTKESKHHTFVSLTTDKVMIFNESKAKRCKTVFSHVATLVTTLSWCLLPSNCVMKRWCCNESLEGLGVSQCRFKAVDLVGDSSCSWFNRVWITIFWVREFCLKHVNVQYWTGRGMHSMLKVTSPSKGQEIKESGTTFHTEQCDAKKDPSRMHRSSKEV